MDNTQSEPQATDMTPWLQKKPHSDEQLAVRFTAMEVESEPCPDKE